MPDASSNRYADLEGIARSAAADHRAVVGGLWEELGRLQLDFLKSRGLRPEHFLIDIGCGSFRAGVKLIPFLEQGHYFGLDLNESLIAIGYEREIVPAGLAERFPIANAIVSDCFDLARLRSGSTLHWLNRCSRTFPGTTSGSASRRLPFGWLQGACSSRPISNSRKVSRRENPANIRPPG
jgi:SAM-dependent methyltransferase